MYKRNSYPSKLSPGHQRIVVHRNSPQKYTHRVAKSAGTLKFASKFPPRHSLLGVSLSTEKSSKSCWVGKKPPRYSRNSEEFISWAWAYRRTPKWSSKTCSVDQKTPRLSQIREDLISRGHQPVAVHRNSPQKHTQCVAKPPGTLKFARKFPPGRYLLGVSLSTETVLKNMLSGSKNAPGTVKIARKLSPGHQRIVNPKIVPKTYSADCETSRYTQIREIVIPRASACRCSPKQSPKTCSAGPKTRQVHSNLRGSFLLGDISWACCGSPKESSETYLEGRRPPQVNSNSRGSYPLGISVSLFTETVPKNVLSGSKTP